MRPNDLGGQAARTAVQIFEPAIALLLIDRDTRGVDATVHYVSVLEFVEQPKRDRRRSERGPVR